MLRPRRIVAGRAITATPRPSSGAMGAARSRLRAHSHRLTPAGLRPGLLPATGPRCRARLCGGIPQIARQAETPSYARPGAPEGYRSSAHFVSWSPDSPRRENPEPSSGIAEDTVYFLCPYDRSRATMLLHGVAGGIEHTPTAI